VIYSSKFPLTSMYSELSKPNNLVDSSVGNASTSRNFLSIALVRTPVLSIVLDDVSTCFLTFFNTSPNFPNSVFTADRTVQTSLERFSIATSHLEIFPHTSVSPSLQSPKWASNPFSYPLYRLTPIGTINPNQAKFLANSPKTLHHKERLLLT
jgi:hypothetical protein